MRLQYRKRNVFQRNKVEIVSACLGVAVFILVYGVKVIDPTNIEWMAMGGDRQQHYLGWCFYRRSSWHFPFGLMDGVVFPNLTSIVYVDGIPIMALLFKILSPVLPETFQYFGLWGVLSAALIGVFSAKILKLYIDSSWIVCISSLFFIGTPVFFRRMFGHTALAGIWVLLWAIYLVCKKSQKSYRIRSGEGGWQWAILSIICASVHMYYIPICGVCLLGWLLIDIFETKSIKNSLVVFALYCACGLLTLCGWGCFGLSTTNLSMAANSLDKYTANLNTFLNPLGGWSTVLEDLPTYTSGQYEGFAYLGLGMLILVIFAVGIRIYQMVRQRSMNLHMSRIVPWVVVLIISTFIALGPAASIGDKALYHIALPEFVSKIWGMFYACGRFIWIPMFLIMIFACCTYRHVRHKRLYTLFLCLCIAIQVFDFSSPYAKLHAVYVADRTWENDTAETITDILGEQISKYKHVVLVSRELFYSNDALMDFARFALDEDMTVNFFLVSRYPRENAYGYTMRNIMNEISDDTIYVFAAQDTENIFLDSLFQYPVGQEYVIGVREAFP